LGGNNKNRLLIHKYKCQKQIFSIDFPKKIPDRPVKTIVDEVIAETKSKIAGSSTKLQIFVEEYDRQFGERHFLDSLTFHYTQTEVFHIIKAALTFYALNMNGQVLIDLAGLLERYAILYIKELFKSLRSVQLFADGQRVLGDVLEKKSLKELAKHLVTLGLWDKEDKKEADRLYDKRNSVAHKNIKKSKQL
jgi:hypothetical protein